MPHMLGTAVTSKGVVDYGGSTAVQATCAAVSVSKAE